MYSPGMNATGWLADGGSGMWIGTVIGAWACACVRTIWCCISNIERYDNDHDDEKKEEQIENNQRDKQEKEDEQSDKQKKKIDKE